MERYAGIVIGLAMTVIGARMLTPADFGIFAVGMSAVLLLDILRDFGASIYIVQLKELHRSAVRSAFTVSCIISGSCAAALALGAVPLGHFYGEPGVGDVLFVVSATMLLNLFSTPAAAMLRQTGISTAYLVTHAWHMPRAQLEAARAGLPVMLAAVPRSRRPDGRLSDWLSRADCLVMSWLSLREWVGLAALEIGL